LIQHIFQNGPEVVRVNENCFPCFSLPTFLTQSEQKVIRNHNFLSSFSLFFVFVDSWVSPLWTKFCVLFTYKFFVLLQCSHLWFDYFCGWGHACTSLCFTVFCPELFMFCPYRG